MLKERESSFRNEQGSNEGEGRKVSRGDFRYNEYYLNVLKVLFRGGLCQGSIIGSKDNFSYLCGNNMTLGACKTLKSTMPMPAPVGNGTDAC